jgi:hypothetical protein
MNALKEWLIYLSGPNLISLGFWARSGVLICILTYSCLTLLVFLSPTIYNFFLTIIYYDVLSCSSLVSWLNSFADVRLVHLDAGG